MYGLWTDGGTLITFLDNGEVDTLKSQKQDKIVILENGAILMKDTVVIRYDDPDKSSAFLYKGYKLVEVVDNN